MVDILRRAARVMPAGGLRGKRLLRLLAEGDPVAALMRRRRFRAAASAIEDSGLFDRSYYLSTYPDVQSSGIDPLVHYILNGAAEGRDPGPMFSTRGYLAANPDVSASRVNPLHHYVSFGRAEGRAVGDLAHLVSLVRRSPHFDSDYYLRRYHDVAASGIDPAVHYVQSGWKEGRSPSAGFNTGAYLRDHPDIEGLNPLVHQIFTDQTSDRPGDRLLNEAEVVRESGYFDCEFYLRCNGDVRAAGVDPALHYVSSGWLEGRDPSPSFSTSRNLEDGADGAAVLRNPLVDWHLNRRYRGGKPLQPRYPHRRWNSPRPRDWEALFSEELPRRLARLTEADRVPPQGFSSPTFSLLTTVYDTPATFVQDLARSLQDQYFRDFEWVLLDNGSRDPATVEACRVICASDPRFRYHRVEDNLHIIGGNRFALERARGAYIVPIDSDDLLYPDSLALFARVLRDEADAPPGILFSDEHRISEDGTPLDLIWRWEMSLAHAMATAPAAHLMALNRVEAVAADLYADDCARGSHDWDSTLRLLERGVRAVHVPEVLYAWRAHSASTAGAVEAKSYIQESQLDVVRASLSRRGLDDRLAVEPLFAGTIGWYRLDRRHDVPAPDLELVFVVSDSSRDGDRLRHNLAVTAGFPGNRRVLAPDYCRAALIRELADSRVEVCGYGTEAELASQLTSCTKDLFARSVVSCCAARLRDADGLWDALGVLEVDPRAGVVGGPVFGGARNVHSLGLIGGLDGFFGPILAGWPLIELPGHLLNVTRRVTAHPALFLVIRGDVLRAGVGLNGVDRDDSLFGLDLCLRAGDLGFETVYVDRMAVTAEAGFAERVGAGSPERQRLRELYPNVTSGARLSPYLTRISAQFSSLRNATPEAVEPSDDGSLFAPAIPLNLLVDPDLEARPRINVLIPAIRMASMSGGPNTALNLAYRLAEQGFAIRLISTDIAIDADTAPIWRHIRTISEIDRPLKNVELADASDRGRPTRIGRRDIFLATAWWTAQMAREASPLVDGRPFIYLIQDYEPILYANSSSQALATETYGFDSIAIFNSSLLKEFLVRNGIGRFRDPEAAERALCFEPAIDRSVFHPPVAAQNGPRRRKRRLLFYARPTSGARNLFELGVGALRALVRSGDLSDAYWDIVGVGEAFEPLSLGPGATLQCAPWEDFKGYARMMRESDLLLSLMLSPHPSYPPLEMAACGGVVVTTAYANKTDDALRQISRNIIGAEPTVEGVATALRKALNGLADTEARIRGADVRLPGSWSESLAPIMERLSGDLQRLGFTPNPRSADEIDHLDLPTGGDDMAYDSYLRIASARRVALYPAAPEARLLSFVTTVWDTPPAFIDVLARSLDGQVGGAPFEWYILDNGSTRPDVIAYLRGLAATRPFVTLERVEANLGIIGGMRRGLERAKGRYVLPLDSDDYLDPDCVRAIVWTLQKNGYPPLLYTDEDKLQGTVRSGAYLKPDWDPVLFVNSCYIAHLCAIDRTEALRLGAYTDPACEGSHDWDTFTRFLLDGQTPVHLPEVLYSWRMHDQSTSSNINAKPVVFDSQRSVLRRFLAGHPRGSDFELVKSPLFGATPDWWLRRKDTVATPPITTLLICDDGRDPTAARVSVPAGVDHQLTIVSAGAGASALLQAARDCQAKGRLVHLQSVSATPADDLWLHEAVGQMELFPDAAVVGGRITAKGRIMSAGYRFGFGAGCECPDRGRAVGDPGYSAQMWKQHSVSAVSAQHLVTDAGLLVRTLEDFGAQDPSFAMLGVWLGLQAEREQRRVVYSPMLLAETDEDWDGAWDPAELGRWLCCAGGAVRRPTLIPPDMGRTRATAGQAVRDAAGSEIRYELLPTYDAWVRRRERTSRRFPQHPPQVRFSVLTSVYSGTDTDLFKVTAEALLRQSWTGFEWLVLSHGAIDGRLRAYLGTLVSDGRVRLFDLKSNLGIIGAMQYLLAQAEGDYVVPLDSDDVLSPDCLQAMAEFIARAGYDVPLVYSDEDILLDGVHINPYLRPDWDPVLDLENSWVWHVCAFQRSLAVELGVYQAAGSEYCHDWDTVYRFARAGHTPQHIRETLYHWRHHARSTSTASGGNSGSSRSVQSLLAEKIRDRGLEGVAKVSPYPIFRGAEEWCVNLAREAWPTTETVVLRRRDADWRTYVRRAAERVGPDGLVILQGEAVASIDHDRLLSEVAKTLAFHDEVVAVSGRLVRKGVIVAAGWMSLETGELAGPYDGLAVSDPGPFVLGWKPQSISAGVVDLLAVRAQFLTEAIDRAPADCALTEFGLWLGALAESVERRIAFNPLMEGEVGDALLHACAWRQSQIAWDSFRSRLGRNAVRRLGAAAYLNRFHG